MAIIRKILNPQTFAGAYSPWTSGSSSYAGDENPAPDDAMQPAPVNGRSGVSLSPAFNPNTSGQPDVTRDIYQPQLRDISSRLRETYSPPEGGVGSTIRHVLGALMSQRNPQLGSIISGDYQRQRQIAGLTKQYGLTEDAIKQDQSQKAAALNTQNIQSEISTRTSTAEHQRQQEDYWNRLANVKEAPPEKTIQKKAGLTYDNGIPVSYQDEKGVTWDVNDPNLPASGKALVTTANQAHSQHVKESADAQARASAAANQRQQNTFSRQDVTAHDKAYVQPAEQVEKSYQMMNHAYQEYRQAKAQGKELPAGAQSMLALSTHLSTTFGNVKGSRVTKDMIHEHLGARSISDSALVAVQRLTNGDVLSPDQWDAFHDLIAQSRKLSWNTAVKEAKRKDIPVDFLPKDLNGLTGDEDAAPTGGGIVRGSDGKINWKATLGTP